jgi:integrase/recombinase XerD
LIYYFDMSKHGQAPYLTADVLDQAIAACDGIHALRDRAILMVSHYLGLRAKEIAALSLADLLDRDSQMKTRILLTRTKGDIPREVYLVHAGTRKAIGDYLTDRRVNGWLGRTDAPLFRSQKGQHFSANSLQRHIAHLYDKAGIDASSHSGRRSFATRLLEAGASIYDIQRLMGHSSITTTQLYFSSSPERLMRVAGLL